MHIAALQMLSTPDIAQNLRQAEALIREAAERGAEFLALPEYFCALGWRDADKLDWCEDWGSGPIQQQLAAWARRYQVWLLAGSLALKAEQPGRVRNTSLLWNPQGDCCARYDKVHLFRFRTDSEQYDEAQLVEAGQTPVVVEVTDRCGQTWRVGLSVCYDLRFPEFYRLLAEQGADLLLVPSAFTQTTGRDHWEVLLRARAIENQCYVLAPAQGGAHENGRQTWGHSLLVDPWGQVLAERSEDGPGVVDGRLERSRLDLVRARLPALTHRVF